jgi:hypothetical protein
VRRAHFPHFTGNCSTVVFLLDEPWALAVGQRVEA